MHHTVAYTELTAAAVTDSQINAAVDGVLSIRNNNFFPTEEFELIYGCAMGVALTRARLDSPSLRQITRPQITPIHSAVTPGNEPRMADYSFRPFKVSPLEELEFQVTDTQAGGEQVTGIFGLRRRFDPIPPGRIYTMVGDSTTPSVANSWTNVTVTWQNTLPAGRYLIVGGSYIAATGKAFRFNLEEQKLQPGGIGVAVIGANNFDKQRMGGFGGWGEFDNTALPEVQVFNNAVVAVHTFFMDFVKIR